MTQLPGVFYAAPDYASMTATRAELRELLTSTGGVPMVNGRLREIKAKHLGAGIYKITLAPLT